MMCVESDVAPDTGMFDGVDRLYCRESRIFEVTGIEFVTSVEARIVELAPASPA